MPDTQADRRKAQIARINEISQLARTAWFSLLGYLVFVGITLLGVEDADFFLPSRQTRLPLINVSIPTASFFWTAPVLAAALYAYLHLFLIKLWDAHVPPTDDSDPTHHWLVNDFVLIRQRDPVARARPLARLTDVITRLLVWAAGPFVIGYAWWRSMPAHNEWMTLLTALCLWITLFIGFTSWWRAEERIGRVWRHDWGRRWQVPSAILLALLLPTVSWLRTEGGLDDYIDSAPTLADVTVTVPHTAPILRLWLEDDLILPLARTNLAGVDLVPLPDDWRTPETARSAFRETWCGREGLGMETCDQPVGPDHRVPAYVEADRQAWCHEHGALDAETCAARFAALDRRFAEAWREERESTRASLPALDLRNRDLRRADAEGASLVGGDLVGVRLEGADLGGALLEGAYLWGAGLQGALLDGARMSDAYLHEARLDGAYLAEAQLQGADLSGATLTRADLGKARLEGADLWMADLADAYLGDARLEGAFLREARLEGADITRARLDGASLQYADFRRSVWDGVRGPASPAHFADLRGVQGLRQDQLERLVGNHGTLLPDGRSDTGAPWYVWSCWDPEPPGLDRIVATAAGPFGDDADRAALRAEFLCSPDNPRRKTGTPLALDAPYPEGHPLAHRRR